MLKFKDSKFKIMQIADTQDTQFTSKDTLNFMGAALDAEKPDLVVFTGDQIKNYGVTLFIGDRDKNIEKTIKNLLAPLEERGVSFTFTYGNHDVPKSTGDYDFQTNIYESSPCCVNKYALARFNKTDVMCLPIQGENSEESKFALYLIDNCSKQADGGHGVNEEQMQAMEEMNVLLNSTSRANFVPAIVFQHVPVSEMYDILKETTKDAQGALEGNVTKRGHYYTVTDEMKARGEFMLESVACPSKPNPQFEHWVSLGNIRGAYFGHDHNNCFTGTLNGIHLGYTPGAGFNVYGPDLNRGVRIFEIDENTQEYTTRVVFYKDLLGDKVENEVKRIIYKYAPSSVDEAKPYVIKGAALLGAVTLAGVMIKRREK